MARDFAAASLGATDLHAAWTDRTYATFDSGTFNAVDCVPGACYAAGAGRRMARLVVDR